MSNAYMRLHESTPRQDIVLDNTHWALAYATIYARQKRCMHILQEIRDAAIMGLCDAANKVDMSTVHQFKAYAVHRVRGEIIDMLRKRDILSQRDRGIANKVHSVIADDDTQSLSVIAEELDMSEEEIAVLLQAECVQQEPLRSGILDEAKEPAVDNIDEADFVLASIPFSRERSALRMFYLRGASLKDIGAVLGVSESGASRMVTRGKNQVRNVLDKQGYMPLPAA